jgi:hypothetical protein
VEFYLCSDKRDRIKFPQRSKQEVESMRDGRRN